MTDPSTWRPDTLAVRGGLARSGFAETAEALYLTSGYVYESAEEAAAAFEGDIDHFVYSRYGNPTIAMFEERLRLLEGAEASWATATGMAAVFNALAACLSAGDRVVAARGLFGSCYFILDSILPRWGITTDFVDGCDLAQWEEALSTPARVVFFETPSNPMQEIIDIGAVSRLAHAAGARVIVDNVFATPLLQRPLELGADIVVYSTTKHIDGQGRTLGGAILGPKAFVDKELQPLMRHTGPSMSPFTAWVLVKSLETMSLRLDRQVASTLAVAQALEAHPGVSRVLYPWLPSHPQHALARAQMSGGGTVVTFEIDGDRADVFAFMNRLGVVDISNNLGDSKSLITHPSTTTHRRVDPEVRARMGITDATVRLSVGLEDAADLIEDLTTALLHE